MSLMEAISQAAAAANIPEQGLVLALALMWPTLTRPGVRLDISEQQAIEVRTRAVEISRRLSA